VEAVRFSRSPSAKASAGARFPPHVQLIGCSNSSYVFQAYDYASTLRVAVNSALPRQGLKEWATEGSWAWDGRGGVKGGPGFDANYEKFGATAVWYPLCIREGDYPSNDKAYSAFKKFVSLLRKRTAAPLYLSDTIGAQPACPEDNQEQQTYVTDTAVAEGLAFRGPDVPAASAPYVDGCHFDPVLSTNVQDTAVAFLDG
jgi:hypothetical protein